MKYRVKIAGEDILEIYAFDDGRHWFITKKIQKQGQCFLSGYVRCFRPLILAEFIHLPEEVFNDMSGRIRKVPKEAWIRCPCVDIVDETKELTVVYFDGRDADTRRLNSYSNNCKEVNGKNKMDQDIQAKLDSYMELLEEIRQKTDDERTAVSLLQEVSKDRRMEAIRDEREAKNNVPATEKQKKFMKKLGIEFPDTVTKQEASVLIDEELGRNGG
jgi:hypothetical protein